MRLNRVLKLAIASLLVALTTIAVPATANADPTYGTQNASGGIYWRSGPDWNTAEAISGFGFYPNSTLQIHCYQSGAGNVPGSADTMWEQATVVGGSGYGSGWVNEHFINDGQPINAPSPGVPSCNPAPAPPALAAPNPTPAPVTAPVPTAAPVAAALGLVFTVTNADGGIYYRNSPSWSDTSQTVGVGVYNGDRVQIICGASGDAVGPYNDTAWSYVSNLSRPSIGNGWVNEHFIDDGAPDNAWPGGVPQCSGVAAPPAAGGSGAPAAPGQPSAVVGVLPNPRTVFYSPIPGVSSGLSGIAVADKQLELNTWKAGSCSTAKATTYANVPATVDTLAGWSLGRLGPIYFLKDSHRNDQIHFIVLFDPESVANMDGGCDGGAKPYALLKTWLANRSHQLIIFTGHNTEDHEFPKGVGRSNFTGLRKYYLKGLDHKLFGSQILICDYNNMTHPDVLKNFYRAVNYPPSNCPIAPNGQTSPTFKP